MALGDGPSMRAGTADMDIQTLSLALRSPMLALAKRLLHPHDGAEDVVQETLLALLESAQGLQQSNDPQRYVFGVLKHKIADALRQRQRHPLPKLAPQDDLDDALFNPQGAWWPDSAPTAWRTPEQALQWAQCMALVDVCVNRLPPTIGQVFGLKVLMECEAPEICQLLGLSTSHYWQCLSRARKQLQLCLHQHGILGATP